MDLKLFFDPVDDSFNLKKLPGSAIAHSIYINKDQMPEIGNHDIALIGIKEARGVDPDQQEGVSKGVDEIRRCFYELKKGSETIKILDLGNFRNGPELEDTYLRLKEVCGHLMSQNILPILIGGAHNVDLGQFYAYEDQNKLITFLNVDSQLDLEDPKTGISSQTHIHKVFKHDPNYLFNYYHLAHQSFLIDPSEIALMEKLCFESVRLGVVKENIKEMEPVIRDADMLSFDISSIQSQYCPGGVSANVFGLTGEEACQICWYAGLNDKLSSAGFYQYNALKDTADKKTAFVVATMLWYFVEGYYSRKGDKNFQSNDYLIYEVALGSEPSSIKFYKSKLSEKWWMEVPHPDESTVFMRSRMIPCSYSDYETALKGEVPTRWINTLSKIT